MNELASPETLLLKIYLLKQPIAHTESVIWFL